MRAFEYILAKQSSWAYNNDIILVGSKGNRGRPAYTTKLEENLFEPLIPEVKKDFENADGRELSESLSKMNAVHSSSALGINIFQYWQNRKQVPAIAAACGLCNKNNYSSQKIRFEQKFRITKSFQFSPNIDVVIENLEKSKFSIYAIECKFSEAYSSRGHSGIDHKYLELDEIWKDIPETRDFAKSISPDDKEYKYLHPAQLIKHILGLKNKFGKKRFRLLYLWYDSLGDEGAKHREEIGRFSDILKRDRIYFHTLSYQELIIKLSKEYRKSHNKYIKYISERYL